MISEEKLNQYCNEDISKIENYEKAVSDKENMWHCHHRLEIGSNGENVSLKDLKRNGLYYNRPASELIFLLASDHTRLHNIGKHFSAETKRKISESCKGNPSPNKGKHFSVETKKKNVSCKKRKTFQY